MVECHEHQGYPLFRLLRGYNSCKQDLLKASNHLHKQRGVTFGGKVLASKVNVLVVAGHAYLFLAALIGITLADQLC